MSDKRKLRKLANLFLHACILVLGVLNAPIAHSEVIDQVDLVEKNQQATLTIRFSQKIIYLRHVVTHDQKNVRVFLRLVDARQSETEIAQEIVKSNRTVNFEGVTVTYPELINAMLVSFKETVQVTVQAGSDGRSIVITTQTKEAQQSPKPEPAAALESSPKNVLSQVDAAQRNMTENAVPLQVESNVTSRVATLKQEIDIAIVEKDYARAIGRLNLILSLPLNEVTEEAQALMGEVREKTGENIKARAEYELYLKLFPEGRFAEKVKLRLTSLPKENRQQKVLQSKLPAEAGTAEWTHYGNLSAYYYSGKSQIEMLTPTAPGQLTFNRDTLSLIDQNSLISSLNLNLRRRDGFSDMRFVLRDTDNHNFLNANRSYNRLYAAYIDYVNRKDGYYVRVGRQNPNGIGVLDRYDGLQAGLNIGDSYRGNVVAGKAVEFGSPFEKKFYGASFDKIAQAGEPGYSLYGVEQHLDGYLNRKAVGAEVRYFDGKATAYSMLDFDTAYKGVNIALIQGNYLSSNGANWFFVIDHRRAPGYSLTNALQAVPGMQLQEIILAQGLQRVRNQASALTAMSDMFSVGVTRQFFDKWQLGLDYRLSSISSTQPVMAVLPLAVIGTCLGRIDSLNNTCVIDTMSQQASGKNHVVTFQAVGSNLWRENAVGVGSLSLIKAPNYTGQAFSLAYALPIGDLSKIDSNFRYYTQSDLDSSNQSRLNFSIKYSYQWSGTLFLEGEIGRETARTRGGQRNDSSTRDYVFLGLRGDFR